MKKIVFVLLTVALICSISFSAFAETASAEIYSDVSDNKLEDSVYFGYEEYFPGDVNGDKRLNAADARLVLRFSAKLENFTEKQKFLADMNSDGKITADDARRIIRAANVGSSLEAKPDYKNTNSASLSFYIDGNGKATVTYTVAIRNNSTQTAQAEIYLEKKTFGVFWKKLDVKYTDSFSERHHVKSFENTVSDEGTYRAVLRLKVGSDDIELKAECEYKKGVLLGDVNGDGRITATDARLILRFSARLEKFTENQKSFADMDRDGRITASDARLALRVAARL